MTPTEITTVSPSKFNLFLDVPSRRSDGYHEVITVLEPLSFFDTLIFTRLEKGIEVHCDHPGVPSGADNIVYQAVELLRGAAGVRKGVRVVIEKKVFTAAGLGGGSANAAVALKVVNRLWGCGCSLDSLYPLAVRLGSDVPFFLRPATALGRGRGEELEALPPAPPLDAVLINPGFEVSTRWAYQQLRVPPGGRPAHPDLEEIRRALSASDPAALAGSLYNVFQETLVPQIPPLADILGFFRSGGALGAVLSGSGPTVIGLADDRSAAVALADRARSFFPDRYRIVVCSNRISGPPV